MSKKEYPQTLSVFIKDAKEAVQNHHGVTTPNLWFLKKGLEKPALYWCVNVHMRVYIYIYMFD